jgi:S-adenosylmethionine/arginine decarboxylase-like enzyme
LLVRAEILSPPQKQDVKFVDDFMTTLVDRVRMKVLSPAVTLWCDEEGNEGITSSILLTTSNSVIHIWNYEDGTGLLEFDLYSCAPFTPEEVIGYIRENFYVTKVSYKFIDREHDLIDITHESKETV